MPVSMNELEEAANQFQDALYHMRQQIECIRAFHEQHHLLITSLDNYTARIHKMLYQLAELHGRSE